MYLSPLDTPADEAPFKRRREKVPSPECSTGDTRLGLLLLHFSAFSSCFSTLNVCLPPSSVLGPVTLFHAPPRLLSCCLIHSHGSKSWLQCDHSQICFSRHLTSPRPSPSPSLSPHPTPPPTTWTHGLTCLLESSTGTPYNHLKLIRYKWNSFFSPNMFLLPRFPSQGLTTPSIQSFKTSTLLSVTTQ